MKITNAVERKFFWKWAAIGLALHIVAAIFSIGHQAADEYFQILEFLNFKLGGTPVLDLPVEYAEQMRPWFQPGLYYVLVKLWAAIGVTNPFTWVLSFRLFAGLIGWASGVLLAWHTLQWFGSTSARRLLVILTALLWFLPVLHVRPSSEGLGGSFFMIGLSLAIWALNESKNRSVAWVPVVSGFSMGLAFESRFQIGVMIAAFAAWWILFGLSGANVRWRWLCAWCLGLLVALAIGRATDAWGYGQWVWSPWNYVDYNLVRGEVNRYGPSAWWDVFRMSATEAWPILGTLLLTLCVVAWVRWPKNVLTWSTASLFIIHCAISHKELRFFFPIAHAAPALVVMAIAHREGSFAVFFDRFRCSGLGRWVIGFLVLMNLVALCVLLCMPMARNVQFYQAYDSWRREVPETRSEVLSFGKDPYEVLGTNTHFYKPAGFVFTRIQDWEELERRLGDPASSRPVYLFLMKARIPADAPAGAQQACQPVIRTLPSWIFELEWLNYGNWMSRAQAWSLFECKR